MMPPKQFQSVRYVMLYLLFGLLWIHGSDTIIALLVSDVDAFEWISRLKGSVFVAISGGFLYLALVRWPAPVDRLFLQGRAQWWIVLGLLLLVFIMPLVGGALVHWFDSAQAADGHHLPLSLLAGVAAMVLSGLLITLYRRQLQYRFSRLAARETLRREELLARFFDMPFMGMALTDPGNGKWLKVNTSLEALLGYDADTLYQRDWQSLTHPDDLLIDEAEFHRLISGDINAYQLEKRFIHANGHVVPVRIYIKLLRDSVGAPEYSICMVQDLTRERADRQALQRQSDLYNMLSRINQLTLYSRSIDEVLQSACRIAVEEGKLRFAWIGRCDEQSRLVEAITYAGDTATATGFDQLFTIFARNPGQGLSEQAVMNGRTEVINDSLQASQYQPWHDFSRRFQCLSAIALPLRHKGRIFANLTLYADTVDFFTPALVNTLEEMAGDIGFALDTITRDEALEAANQVINSSPFVLIRWQNSPGWPILFVSDNIRSWGIEPQTLVEHSGTFEAFIHPDDQLQIADDVHRFLQQGETTYTQTYRLILPQNDTVIWVEDKTYVLRDASGEVVGLEGVLIDITERRQQESRLQQAVAVIQSTREAVLITGEDQQIVQVNPAFSEMFGWSEEALSGKTPAVLRSGCHDARFYRELWQQVSARGHWQGEIMSRRRSGEVFPALLSISRVCSDTDEVTHYVGVYTDLSRLKDSESRLEHLSTHDALTGLPNRKALFHELEYCG
ncbi:MAG: PAS domain S-box protein, partial [Oceanospirillales bacterium]|nr:PAS domain S-box protein [Oceanospirillales bacterium]